MKCPACFNPLSQLPAGKFSVDVCRGGCGGIWFDAFELQEVDEPGDTAADWLLKIERDPSVYVDPTRKRACPRCDGVKLMRQYFSAKRRVEIDHCPGCGGYWLDAGELEKIRKEMEETARQRELQAERSPSISAAVIRYLYQMRIAERE
jgi:Zn-finger nucleic acid-binding protein